MVSKNVKRLADVLLTVGNTSITEGTDSNDDNLVRLGNLIALLGHISHDGDLLIEFDNFVGYFSACKILNNTSPKNLVLAKALTEMSAKNPMIDGFLDELINGNKERSCESCDDCDAKDICASYVKGGGNGPAITNDEKPKDNDNKEKPKKTRKPRKKSDDDNKEKKN
jgi:hypothetical protein